MKRSKIFRWVLTIIAIVIAALGIWFYHYILSYLLIAFLLAYLISPIIKYGSKYGIPRALSILITYAVIITLIIIAINIIVPQIRQQAEEGAKIVKRTQAKLNSQKEGEMDVYKALNTIGLEEFSQFVADINSKFKFVKLDKYMNQLLDRLIKLIAEIPQFLLNSISGIINLLAFIVVIPFISFFLLNDERKLMRTFFSWIPNRYFEFSLYLFQRIEDSFGRFFRALLLETFIIFILAFIGLMILNVPYALTLSLIVGLTNPIKFFGPFLGVIPIYLVVLLGPTPDIYLLYTSLLILLIQQFDSNYLFPALIGKKIGMHPLWVLLTVISGGYAFGVVGLIFAVPVVFLIKTIIEVSAKSLKQFEII